MEGKTIKLSQNDKDRLVQVFKNEQFPQELYPYFEKKYCELTEGVYSEEMESAIDFPIKYVRIVADQLKMGHSLDWADLYADKETDFDEYIVYEVYKELQTRDKELVMSELKKHAEALLSDEIAKEVYVKIITDGYGFSDRETKEKSIRYSSLYKREIANGKTEIYAEKYACAIAIEKHTKEYAELTAELYDFASKKGETDFSACYTFVNDCVDAYINAYFVADYEKLRKQYTKEWQQEALLMLNKRIDEESENHYLPLSGKRHIDAEMMNMMYPEGYDDDEMSELYDDDL